MADDKKLVQLPMDHLRTLVAVVENGGFTAAGRAVHRTQAAVSMQIKRLEEDLGCALFVRAKRSVRLTSAGDRLVGYARKILRLHDEAISVLFTPELSGTVRLGAPEDYAGEYLPGVLARFIKDNPLVTVDILCEPTPMLLEALRHGQLDLTLASATGVREASEATGSVIHRESLSWAVATGFETHLQRPLPLAVFHKGCPYRHYAGEALEQAGIASRVSFVSPSLSGVLAAVRAGLAVAPVPSSLVAPDCRLLDADEGLPPLPEVMVELHRAPAGQCGPVVDRLCAALTEEFRERRNRKRAQSLRRM